MKKILNILFYIFIIIFTIFIVNISFSHFMSSIGKRNINFSNYKEIKINENKIFYKDYGRGEVIVLLHGFLGSSNDLEKVALELSKNNRVILPDIPGFGLSSNYELDKESKEEMAKALINFITELNIKKYDLLGHSMGGEVALHMALKDNRVNDLFLIDSQGYQNNDFYPEFLKEHPGLSSFFIRTFFQNYFFQRYLSKTGLYNIDNYNNKDFLKSYYLNYNIPSITIHKINVDDDGGFISNVIKNIKNKTYIIWGDNDNVVDISNAKKFNQEIKNSELFIIKNSGHNPFLENFESIMNIIKNKTRE